MHEPSHRIPSTLNIFDKTRTTKRLLQTINTLDRWYDIGKAAGMTPRGCPFSYLRTCTVLLRLLPVVLVLSLVITLQQALDKSVSSPKELQAMLLLVIAVKFVGKYSGTAHIMRLVSMEQFEQIDFGTTYA